MRVHLHTVCWNDAARLEFFFRHYEPWVEHFFIHDDGSNDGGLEVLQARPDVSVQRLVRSNEDSWVLSAKKIYDTSWVKSRGTADWVVIANIDELLHHPDMLEYLTRMHRSGVTAVPALGYQMIHRDFPVPGSMLWRDYPLGAPWRQMSKVQIFRPDSIQKTDFSPGRHRVELDGLVVYPERDEAVNLHYKYLGLSEVFTRQTEQAKRLGKLDNHQGWGHKYHWRLDELTKDFERFESTIINILEVEDHHENHSEPRWWRP